MSPVGKYKLQLLKLYHSAPKWALAKRNLRILHHMNIFPQSVCYYAKLIPDNMHGSYLLATIWRTTLSYGTFHFITNADECQIACTWHRATKETMDRKYSAL